MRSKSGALAKRAFVLLASSMLAMALSGCGQTGQSQVQSQGPAAAPTASNNNISPEVQASISQQQQQDAQAAQQEAAVKGQH